MRIELDGNAARKAESAPRIDKTGEYIGIFTKARKITAKSGAIGIEFEFMDTSTEATADFLTIYTHKADGSPTYGLNAINALMVCLKLRAIESGMIKAEIWDDNERKKVPQQVEGFPDLMNKAIGVVLQAEEYVTGSGDLRQRMTLVGFFEATTRFMATEILDRRVTPQALDKFLKSLPEVKKAKQTGQQVTQTQPAPDIPNDDIPF